jgi:SAM-dependent methyltransferase
MSESGDAHAHSSASCPLCAATVARPAFRRGATWWNCPGCGLFFVLPQPDARALSRLYHTTYYASPSDDSSKSVALWHERLVAIERVHPPGKVLDVGCGRGQFISAACQRGWDAWGLEVTTGAVKNLPTPLRARVAVGQLQTSPFTEESFDALTLFDVIEHVRQPVEFLRHCHRLLRPNGTLVITTPNAATLKARIKGRYWKYFKFDRYLHLYHFTPHTIELALQRADFEVASWLRRKGMPLWVAARKI